MKLKILIGVMITCVLATGVVADDTDLSANDVVMSNLLDYGTGVLNYIQTNKGTDFDQKVDINDTSDALIVKSYGFKNTGNLASNLIVVNSIAAQSLEDEEPLTITKPLLNYPNPARQQDGVEIRYGLSKDADIELQIYDMMANLIFKNQFNKGAEGARQGYNRLYLTSQSFNGYALSAGIYFYLLVNNGVVIAKSKMAIVP